MTDIAIDDLPPGQLGEARVTAVDANGLPTAGVIVLDIDAAGVGWFVDDTPADHSEFGTTLTSTAFHADTGAAAGRYDLLTVALHEAAHLLGFNASLPGFAAHLGTLDGSQLFVGPDFTVRLADEPDHTDAATYPHDLMSATLAPGQRRLPSAEDIAIIRVVRGTQVSTGATVATAHAPKLLDDNGNIIGFGNGDFSQGSTGLYGWITSDSTLVTVSPDLRATLRESARDQEVTLHQDFLVPLGATSLSFTLNGYTFDSLGTGSGVTPDAFGVSLLNPHTRAKLYTGVDGQTDALYIRDLLASGNPEAANGVTVAPGTAPGSLRITVPLTGFEGQDARIEFRLISGSDGSQLGGSVTLSDVEITETDAPTARFGFAAGTVPEGDTAVVTFADPTDPTGGTGAFRYSYDFNNDGTYEIVDSAAASATVPASFLDDGPTTRIVRGRIKTEDGRERAYLAAVGVSNVAPTAVIENGGPVTTGSPVQVRLTGGSDHSTTDAGSLRYAFATSAAALDLIAYAAASPTPSATFTFATAGDQTLYGRIYDKDGGINTYQTVVRVESGTGSANEPPAADAGVDQTVNEGDLVTLHGGFTDPDAGDSHTFNWHVVSSNGQVIADGDGQTFSFTPDDNGTYTATFTVTDSQGAAASDTLTVTAKNVAPTAEFSSVGAVYEGTPGAVQFLHLTDASSIDALGAFYFSFDFDDDGTFEVVNSTASSATVPASYLADGPATRTVRGRVTDKDGDSTDYRADVVVRNGDPTVAMMTGAQSINEGQSVTVSGTFGDLAFGVPTETFTGTALWSDGVATPVTISGATFGTSRTFADDVPGGVTVTVTILDDDGGSGSATSGLVSVANLPPTANPDTGSTDENTTLAVGAPGVLGNDSDPAGAADPLAVVPFTGPSARGALVTLLADGRYTYDPTAAAALQALDDGESLIDTFTYTVHDGDSGTALGLVTITVAGRNDAPSLSNTIFNLAENRPNGTVVGTVVGADVDVEPLAYALVGGNTGGAFVIDANGIITVANAAALNFETNPTFTLTVSVSDGTTTTTATVTVQLTNVNEAIGFDVQKSQTQRSFVRYQDLTFESSAGLAALAAAGPSRVKLTRYGLDWNGTDPGTAVSLTGVVQAVGATLAFDFGVQGIGGNRNTTAGDGYYVFELDTEGDGTFETRKAFYRLLGNVNADRTVNQTDADLVLLAYGLANAERDVNGDGIVNATDRTLVIRSFGRALGTGLHLDD